jgi:hypothetical protein
MSRTPHGSATRWRRRAGARGRECRGGKLSACPRTTRSTRPRESSRRPPPCWPCGTFWSKRASSRPTSSSTRSTGTAHSSSSSSASAATPRAKVKVKLKVVARGHAGGDDRAVGASGSATIRVAGTGDSSFGLPVRGLLRASPPAAGRGAVPPQLWVSAPRAPGTRPDGHRPLAHFPPPGAGAVGPNCDARPHPAVSASSATVQPRRSARARCCARCSRARTPGTRSAARSGRGRGGGPAWSCPSCRDRATHPRQTEAG